MKIPSNKIRPAISLSAELEEIQSAIRHDPGTVNLRVYLFQLLCILGHWQRALAQLQVCAQLDATTLPMAKMYRELLRCELLRAEVFSGKRMPQVLGEPPDWLGWLIEAQQRLASGDVAGSTALRTAAWASAPETSGIIDGAPFNWLGDADSRLGPVLEAIINGQYYWIPFTQLRKITLDAPADLRDLVWLPISLTFINDGQTIALIPTRYVNTEFACDDDVKRARVTHWTQIDDATTTGTGQRMLITDHAEHALLDVRHIQFHSLSH